MLAIGTKVIVTKSTFPPSNGVWGIAKINRHNIDILGVYEVKWEEVNPIIAPHYHQRGTLSPNWEEYELMPVAMQSIIET